MKHLPKIPPLPRVRLPRLPQVFTIRAPQVSIRIPRIGKVRLTGSKPLLWAMVLVAISFAITIFVIIETSGARSPVWPEAGGSYLLPVSKVGEWIEPERTSQTIQVNLADGAQIDTLSFTDVSLGKTGLTACFQVGRAAGNNSGFLYVDNFIMTGVSAPSFDMANTEANVLTLAGKADGRTNGGTLDNTISEQVVGSTRGVGSFTASNASADRVIISLLGSATVKTLSLSSVACSVGSFDLDYIRAGTITQDTTSRFGTGSGINSPDYVIQSSVKYKTSTDSMLDEPTTVR